MSRLRWESYVLVSNSEFDTFCSSYFNLNKRILFIIGKGFDIRMNFAISRLFSTGLESNIDCMVINYDEGVNSSSHDYDDMINKNLQELKALNFSSYVELKVESWTTRERQKRYIGDRDITEKIFDYDIG